MRLWWTVRRFLGRSLWYDADVETEWRSATPDERINLWASGYWPAKIRRLVGETTPPLICDAADPNCKGATLPTSPLPQLGDWFAQWGRLLGGVAAGVALLVVVVVVVGASLWIGRKRG